MENKNIVDFIEKRMHRSGIKSKKGNVLVLVVILFMFVSILALGILAMSETESRIVHYDERHDQAYYIARSVVDATETWISSNFNDRASMKKVVPDTIGSVKETAGSLDGNGYTLKVSRSSGIAGSDLILIEAIATYNGVSASAKMSLTETISGYNLFDDAIYSYKPFGKTAGNAITLYPGSPPPSVSTNATYNAHDTSKINQAFYPLGNAEINQGVEYTFVTVNPPGDVTYITHHADSVTFTGNTTIEHSMYFHDDLILEDDTTLIINNSDPDVNIHIRVDGDLLVKSQGNKSPVVMPSDYYGGKIFFYIYGTVTCVNPATLTVQGDSGPAVNDNTGPAIFFICNGSSGNLVLIGNPYIKAFVYAPKMNVELGGGTDLYGAVIADEFSWNGNIGIHYVKPYSFIGTPFENMDLFNQEISIANQTWLNG